MNLKEFYIKCNGNYQDAMSRFLSEERVIKFLHLFLNDDSYTGLTKAIADNDYAAGFRYSHNLKGVAANLSLDSLFTVSSNICEMLRSYSGPIPNSEVIEALKPVTEQYELVVKYINEL